MPGAVARLIEGTGSHIDSAGLQAYSALFATTGHVGGALGMMANWDLPPLLADLGKLPAPLTLIVGQKDLAVPPDVADEVKAKVPHAQAIVLPGLGHLAHEEAPAQIAALIRETLLSVEPVSGSAPQLRVSPRSIPNARVRMDS